MAVDEALLEEAEGEIMAIERERRRHERRAHDSYVALASALGRANERGVPYSAMARWLGCTSRTTPQKIVRRYGGS